MDDEGTHTICPTCRERVDPTLMYGFKQVEVTGMGQSRQWADGLGGYFQPGCFPGPPSYRQAPRP